MTKTNTYSYTDLLPYFDEEDLLIDNNGSYWLTELGTILLEDLLNALLFTENGLNSYQPNSQIKAKPITEVLAHHFPLAETVGNMLDGFELDELDGELTKAQLEKSGSRLFFFPRCYAKLCVYSDFELGEFYQFYTEGL